MVFQCYQKFVFVSLAKHGGTLGSLRLASVCPSICPSVCLFGSRTFLVVAHSYVLQAAHKLSECCHYFIHIFHIMMVNVFRLTVISFVFVNQVKS